MKQLSKALAIALMVACAVAFMPLLNGQAFAAAKKPAKVKSLKAVQVTDTLKAKVTWKKGKNCKKYNVKVDGKIVKKNQKAKSYTTADLTEGAHKIAVAGVNGKKVGKYKTVTVNIVAPTPQKRTIEPTAKLTYSGSAVVGDTVTASIAEAATVTYQWSRVSASGLAVPIEGATNATYKFTSADVGSALMVTVVVDAADPAYEGTATATTAVITDPAASTGFYAVDPQPIAGVASRVGYGGGPATPTNYAWYVDGTIVKNGSDDFYTPAAADVGKALTCTVSYKVNGDAKTATVNFSNIAKNIFAETGTNYQIKLSSTNPEAGSTVTAKLVKYNESAAVAPEEVYAGSSTVEWEWSYTTGSDADAKKTVLSTTDSLEINAAAAGRNNIICKATVTPGADNYAGTSQKTLTAGADEIDKIEIVGTPAIGTEVKALITGKLGTDMTLANKNNIKWQVSRRGSASAGLVWDEDIATNQITCTPDRASYFGDDKYLRIKVGGDLYSEWVKINPLEVNSIDLNWVDGDEYEAVTVGKPISVVLNGSFSYTGNSNLTDLNAYYYTADTEGDVFNQTPSTSAFGNAVANKYYGVKLQYAGSTGWVVLNTAQSGVATPVAEKTTIPGAGVGYLDEDGELVKPTTAVGLQTGDVLKAYTDWTSGIALSYQWFQGNKNNPIEGATGAEYTLTDNDAGKTIGVVISREGYKDTPVTNSKITVSKAMNVTVTFGQQVGTASTVEGAPAGATFTWSAKEVGGSASTIAGATKAEYVAKAAENGKLISVTVEATGYKTVTETMKTPVVPGTTAAEMVTVSGLVKVEPTDSLRVDFAAEENGEAKNAIASAYKWYGGADNNVIGTESTLALNDAYADYGVIYAKVTYTAAYGGETDVAVVGTAVYDDATNTWSIQK